MCGGMKKARCNHVWWTGHAFGELFLLFLKLVHAFFELLVLLHTLLQRILKQVHEPDVSSLWFGIALATRVLVLVFRVFCVFLFAIIRLQPVHTSNDEVWCDVIIFWGVGGGERRG